MIIFFTTKWYKEKVLLLLSAEYIMADNDTNDNDDILVPLLKGHHRLIKRTSGAKKFIDIFTSKFTPGSSIRCAITGYTFTQFKVGSRNEDLFFKVCLSGVLPETSYGRFLYYSTPMEYECHFDTTLDETIKKKWSLKNNRRENEILNEQNAINEKNAINERLS